ncbi:MAG: hypothetical protein L0211_01860, partial [Planctomycetaceae bacterium]|nr:hypothetical protein [Planctomycetaceae bacterium]
MTRFLGRLLGIENVTSIDEIDASLAAPWAAEGAFWVFLCAAALVALSLVFYLRYQAKGPVGPRFSLAICRGLLLALLFITLADPVLRLTVVNKQKPFLYLVFDGTDSMAIEDELPDAERKAIETAVDYKGPKQAPETREVSTSNPLPGPAGPSRMDYVAALLRKSSDNLLNRLTEDKKVQIEAYVFDGDSTSRLRKLELSPLAALVGGGAVDPAHLAVQLSTKGQVTALGSVVHEVGEQFG